MAEHLLNRRGVFFLSLIAGSIGATLFSDPAGADPPKDRHQRCETRIKQPWDAALQPLDQLARGFLAVLCSSRTGAAYHGTIVWSAAANENTELWKRAAAFENDRILRVVETFALDASADAAMRIAAIGALADFARHAGKTDGGRTLDLLLKDSTATPLILSAVVRSLLVVAPKRAGDFLRGRLDAVPDDDVLRLLTSVADPRSMLAETDLRNALVILSRLTSRAIRAPFALRSERLREISNAQAIVVRVAAQLPEDAKASFAVALTASSPGRESMKLLNLSPDATRRVAVEAFKNAKSSFALTELVRLFLPEDDQNGEIAAALAEAIKRLDPAKTISGPTARSRIDATVAILNRWPHNAMKDLAGQFTAKRGKSTTGARNASANKDSVAELLTKLKDQRGAERRATLLAVLQSLDAEDIDSEKLVEALDPSTETRADDLDVLRTVAEKSDDTSGLAVAAIRGLSTEATRAADIESLRRLVRMKKGSTAESDALNALDDWAGNDKASHVQLLRELIAAGGGDDTQLKAINLLFSSQISTTAADLALLRPILAARKGGEADEKAINILAEKGNPSDRAAIVRLIDPDYGHAVTAMQMAATHGLDGAGPGLRKVLAARRSQDQLNAAIDAAVKLRVREALEEIVQIVTSPETDEVRARAAASSRDSNQPAPNDGTDRVVMKALDAVVALDKVQKLSDEERDRIGEKLVAKLATDVNKDVSLKLQTTLGAIRYTGALGEILAALIRLDATAEAARAKDRIEGLRGMLGLVGDPIPTVMPILRATSQNRFEEVRLRSAAHLAGGDDPGAEVLIAALGPEAPFQPYLENLDQKRTITGLEAFVKAYELKDATAEDRKNIAERARELALRWCGAGAAPDAGYLDELIAQARRLLRMAAVSSKDCTAPELAQPIAKLAAITKDDTFKRLIAPPFWTRIVKDYWQFLLLHPLAWIALVLFYPRSPTIQSIFFWNRYGRLFLGLFYVHFLLTYVPPLRRRMLKPLERDLLDGAGVTIDQPEPFFDRMRVTDGDRDLGTAIDVLLGRGTEQAAAKFAAGPLLIEGASGLGKSALLREYTRRLRAAGKTTVVFLAAEKCAEGVGPAILQRLKINTPKEDNYVSTLVHTGGLVLVIDGVNEVGPETRIKISDFVADNRNGRIVLATQPAVWRNESIPRLELQPLRPEDIESFLSVYASSRPADAEGDAEQYRERVGTFAASAVAVGDEDHRTLLSRPVMLAIISRLIWLGEEPQMNRLVEQIIDRAEHRYEFFAQGGEFPRQAFADFVLDQAMKSRKSGFPVGDLATCWVTLENQRLARPVGARNSDGNAQEYAFVHELFLSFYLSVALFPPNLTQIAQRQAKGEQVSSDQVRWQAALDKVDQFRSAYFYYADAGPEPDVRAVAAFWKKRWLDTNDRFYREFEIRIERRFPAWQILAAA